jgi:hypothetical protein
MRILLYLLLALPVSPAATSPTIDDVVEKAQRNSRRTPEALAPAEVAQVPPAHWSPALALAGTLILLTSLTMAFTAFVVEIGLDLRSTKRVRIKLTPLKQL